MHLARRAWPMAVGSALAAIAVISVVAEARAAGRSSSRLVYEKGDGAARCPSEAAMRDSVAARLGYDPFDAKAKKTIAVRIVGDAAKLSARVDVTDAAGVITGTRELRSASLDCVDLASSLSLTITIAIDPLASSEPPPSLALPPMDPGVSSAGSDDDTSASSPDASASADAALDDRAKSGAPADEPEPPAPAAEDVVVWPRFVATAGVVSSIGFGPSLGAGASVSGAVRWSSLSIGLEGRADVPSSKVVPGGGGQVSASVLLATLVPCVHRGVVMACALGSFGALRGSGVGAGAREASTRYAAVGGRLATNLEITSSVAVRIAIDLAATLTRTTLRYADVDVWTTPAIAGALGASLVGTF